MQPSADQIAAVVRFARDNGRSWKNNLRDAWMNGNYRQYCGDSDVSYLQQIRNQFGPEWLVKFSLKKTLPTTHVCPVCGDHYETFYKCADGTIACEACYNTGAKR